MEGDAQSHLNIGLRYGYDQPLYEVNNKEVNVDVKNPQNCPNCLLVAGKNGASRALYNPFYTQFMPRLSFAYQMNPQMVIRGGYGITDDFEGMGAAQRLTQNPPFIPQYSYSSIAPSATSGGTPIKVSQGFNVGGLSPVPRSKYNAWDPNIKPELIQQYNLTIETLMGPHFTFQIGYVGNVAQHLVIPEPINQQTIPGPTNTATQPFIEPRRHRRSGLHDFGRRLLELQRHAGPTAPASSGTAWNTPSITPGRRT